MLAKLHTSFQQFLAARKKYDKSFLIKCAVGVSLITMLLVTFLVIKQYRFFKAQTEKMIELKEDYRNYVVAVKRVLKDYQKAKERLDELETMLEEKKNEFEDVELNGVRSGFPDGVRVYSSDAEDEEEHSSFNVINRDLEYLKQSTNNHLKKQNLTSLMNQIRSDLWLDYTDQVEREQRSQEKAHAKKPNRKRRYASQHKQNYFTRQQKLAEIQQELEAPKDKIFGWPVDRSNFWLSSFFGPRKKPNGAWGFHRGIDMAAVKGTPVKAAANGVVVEARYAPGYGKTIVVAHDRKYRTRYAHLQEILVSVGQKVERGKKIGKVGNTGFVRSKRGGDGTHLHFEVYVYGKQVNPMHLLS